MKHRIADPADGSHPSSVRLCPVRARAQRWRGARLVLLALLALAGSAGVARANGRFPRADQLVLVPGGTPTLLLRTTFGLLSSRDAGASWDWVCEQAIGFSGIEDPALAVLPDGVLLAGLVEGLARSSDGGCSWQFVSPPAAGTPIVDLSARRDGSTFAAALAWERQPPSATAPGYRARLFGSDDGASWRELGSGIDPSVLVLTLDIAPSDGARLYASGIRSGAERSAALFVSVDGGDTWLERPAPFDPSSEQGLYIAAVDPFDPELVYLRTSGVSSSRLLVSADAGASFVVLFTGGPMLGFALSADGSRIYLGGLDDGLWAGTRDALAFEQRSTLPVVCLTSSADLLYACSNDLGGFALGVSRDGGLAFEPVLQLADVRGPLQCSAGASIGVCDAYWPATAERLGAAAAPPAPSEPPGGDPVTPSRAGDTGCSAAAGAPGARSPWPLLLLFALQSMWRARRQISGQGRRGSRTIQIG